MIKLGVLTPIWIICGLLSLSAEASVLSRFTCFVNRFKNQPSQVTPVEATRPQVARAPAAVSEPAPVSEGVVALTHRMETAQAVIANLYKNHDYVHSIGPSLQEEEMGESNIAVHRVQTESGPAVLKYELGNIPNLQHALIIQDYLAGLGLAPKIRAVIPPAEMRTLFEKNGKMDVYRYLSEETWGGSFGVVMDEVEGAWNFLKSDRIPPEITHWNETDIISQIRNIESAFNRLQIVPRDLQLAISKEGRVQVIDVNEFGFVTKDGKIYQNPSEDRPLKTGKADLSGVIRKIENLFREARSTDTSVRITKEYNYTTVTGSAHSSIRLSEVSPEIAHVSSLSYPFNLSGEIAPLLHAYFSAHPGVQTIRYELDYRGPDMAAFRKAREAGKTTAEAYASTPFFKACKSLGFAQLDAEWGKDQDVEPYIQVHRGAEHPAQPHPRWIDRGYVGDEHPQYYDPKTGVFNYPAHDDPGLALDNGDTPLRFLRLNFGNTSHVDRIFPRALSDTVELMKQEPNLKLRIALRSEDRARLEPFLKDLPHQIRARLELLELPGVSLLRTWARDPSLLLTDGKTMLISRERTMGAVSEELTGDMPQDHIDDYYKSVHAYATKAGLQVKTSAFRFEGGNIVVGRKNAFVGAQIIQEAMQDYNLTQIEAIHALSKEFGKPVQVVGELSNFSTQPKAHVDLAMGIVRNLNTGQETVLVESYLLAKDLLARHPSAQPSNIESMIRKTHAENRFNFSDEQEQLDALATQLQKEGYHVIRVPGVDSNYKTPDLPMINYTNVLVTGRSALVPHFGVKALDTEVFTIFEQLGYHPIAATAAPESFKDHGGPRCLTEACRE